MPRARSLDVSVRRNFTADLARSLGYAVSGCLFGLGLHLWPSPTAFGVHVQQTLDAFGIFEPVLYAFLGAWFVLLPFNGRRADKAAAFVFAPIEEAHIILFFGVGLAFVLAVSELILTYGCAACSVNRDTALTLLLILPIGSLYLGAATFCAVVVKHFRPALHGRRP